MKKSRKVSRSRKPKPNWLDLPPDVTAKILSKLGAIEILMSTQKVCTAWRKICKDPEMWRTINMWNLGDLHGMPYSLDKMCRHAVDCSAGHLVDVNIEYFGNDRLLKYITNRSSQIRCLRLACCYDVLNQGLIKVAPKLPLLEGLDLSLYQFSPTPVEVIGRCGPVKDHSN